MILLNNVYTRTPVWLKWLKSHLFPYPFARWIHNFPIAEVLQRLAEASPYGVAGHETSELHGIAGMGGCGVRLHTIRRNLSRISEHIAIPIWPWEKSCIAPEIARDCQRLEIEVDASDLRNAKASQLQRRAGAQLCSADRAMARPRRDRNRIEIHSIIGFQWISIWCPVACG